MADPRDLPPADLKCCPLIVALDGTWHRPFTTLEHAALQSFPVLPSDGAGWLVLDGRSESRWRERIGNAVPPDAAQAVASTMLRTLLLADLGTTFMLSTDPIWVDRDLDRSLAIALGVDVP